MNIMNFNNINIEHFCQLEHGDLTEILNIQSSETDFLNKCGIVPLENYDHLDKKEAYDRYLSLLIKSMVINRVSGNFRNELLDKLVKMKKELEYNK